MRSIIVVMCLAVSLNLAGCGGDESDNVEFTLSTQSLSFVAERRFSGPDPQFISATVNTDKGGTLYIRVEVSGDAIGSVGNFSINGSSGSGAVYPADPSVLEPGKHVGSIVVKACLDSPTCASGQLSGSPRTVTVNYDVRPVAAEQDTVAPRVAISNTAGDLIIRAKGGLLAATDIKFGTTAAISFEIVSDTEIRIRRPALPAGSHAVSINNGALSFSGVLTVVEPQTYTAAVLNYPLPAPSAGNVSRPIYDAERKTVYVVLRSSSAAQNRLVKYVYGSGAWDNGQVKTISNLRGVILGSTRTSLLGYAGTSILEIDPDTLTTTASYPFVPKSGLIISSNQYFNNLALTNDGHAIVTFGLDGSGNTPICLFSTSTHVYHPVYPNRRADWAMLSQSTAPNYIASASEDGSIALIGSKYSYSTSTGIITSNAFPNSSANLGIPLAMDSSGFKFALSDPGFSSSASLPAEVKIYDADYLLLGTVPRVSTLGNSLSAVSPDGKRIYVLHLDYAAGAINAMSVFDLTAPTAGGFAQIGVTVPLTAMAVSRRKTDLAITPDERAIFVGADNGLFVLPLP